MNPKAFFICSFFKRILTNQTKRNILFVLMVIEQNSTNEAASLLQKDLTKPTKNYNILQ